MYNPENLQALLLDKMTLPLVIVVAVDARNAIGRNGALPWSESFVQDMKRLRTESKRTVNASKHNAVIMGRRTWLSIPIQHRPLKDRITIVLSSSPLDAAPDQAPAHVCASLQGALDWLNGDLQRNTVERAFIFGGARLYREALHHPSCTELLVTRIHHTYDGCDVYMPAIDERQFALDTLYEPMFQVHCDRDETPRYQLLRYVRVRPPHEEYQYLDLVRECIDTGVRRDDRTGTGTLAVFGRQTRWSLRNGVLPLLTTKRVFWRGVARELLWLIAGSTDAAALARDDVHIWDANGSRAFLDSRGLQDREEGDLGPVYGFQWRHWGAQYETRHTDYTDRGIDQLQRCIDLIRNAPTDRRIVMSAWNVSDLDKMALPPCHMFCQFFVADGELSCQMYQRSCDMGLGVPFNIASYALLTHMVAHVCGLRAGEFIHTCGDTHVYANHVDALREQLQREPRPFPTLSFKRNLTEMNDFCYDDLVLHGYAPHKAIKMDMAV